MVILVIQIIIIMKIVIINNYPSNIDFLLDISILIFLNLLCSQFIKQNIEFH